ncbi:hypothetical protein SESBI_36341 [Sesbania bispinosa]|nr:hypothetical protein SESBI_36341 [Sesbania bispinosa]
MAQRNTKNNPSQREIKKKNHQELGELENDVASNGSKRGRTNLESKEEMTIAA